MPASPSTDLNSSRGESLSEMDAQIDAVYDVVNTAEENVLLLMGSQYADSVRDAFDDVRHFATSSISSGWVNSNA